MMTMKTHIRLSKKFVLEKFGGVEAAAQACGLSSVQAVYAWPETLSVRQSLMCHGALCLLKPVAPRPPRPRTRWLGGRAGTKLLRKAW